MQFAWSACKPGFSPSSIPATLSSRVRARCAPCIAPHRTASHTWFHGQPSQGMPDEDVGLASFTTLHHKPASKPRLSPETRVWNRAFRRQKVLEPVEAPVTPTTHFSAYIRKRVATLSRSLSPASLSEAPITSAHSRAAFIRCKRNIPVARLLVSMVAGEPDREWSG